MSLSTDGWKDGNKNPVAGINVACNRCSHLVQLIPTLGHVKDGFAICDTFEKMIVFVEEL